jgi:16S rRNA (adenine1518-N6/adenine1519-N6)-dimethyltransferase
VSATDLGPPLREIIARHKIGARKSLGQHFLLDLNLTRRIARAAEPQDATILEIGPGPGGLTRALVAEGACHVVAIERDRRCVAALAELSAHAPGKLTVVEADARMIDERALIEAHPQPIKIVANLPFNIGTYLLLRWLTTDAWPPWYASMTLMLQREVALRLTAHPRSKDYGRLSVLAQWRTVVTRLFDVSPRAFTPPPKVTSSVVSLVPRAKLLAEAPLDALMAVTGAAFGQRRKMLRSSLSALGVATLPLLAVAQIDPQARAESLDVAAFAALARAYAAQRGPAPSPARELRQIKDR